MKLEAQQRIWYSKPAYYIITIVSEIPPDVIGILSNFYSGNFEIKIQNKNTILEGLIKDQTALCGLLSYLSDLHYILLSVNTQE